MSGALAIANSQAPTAIPRQAERDDQLIAMWLHGRPETTQRAYRREVDRFLRYVGKPLREVTVGDVQAFADSLEDLKPRSRARALSAIKSLLSFAQRVGYTTFNVGAPVQLPKVKNDLAERILPEDAVQAMVHHESNTRNRTILRVLYAGGLRVSELAGLRWRDVQGRDEGGQVTVHGKGGETRAVRLYGRTWVALVELRGDCGPDDAVFRSRKGGRALSTSQILRIVRDAAKRAGVDGQVSPHWLRHAHASHSLDRGAPIHLVQQTLGHASVATTGTYLHARPGESSGRYLGL